MFCFFLITLALSPSEHHLSHQPAGGGQPQRLPSLLRHGHLRLRGHRCGTSRPAAAFIIIIIIFIITFLTVMNLSSAIWAHSSTYCVRSAGSPSGEQDAATAELRLRALPGDGHRHLPLHQPGHHRIHVLRRHHRRQHHPQPAQLLVRPSQMIPHPGNSDPRQCPR